MKTPINARTLRQHLTYNWWKYLLIIAVAFGLVDLLYTVTAYRSPRDKTVGFYVYGYMNETDLKPYLDNIRETEMSDMEEINAYALTMDETYGPMQMVTYIAAGEGDIYLFSRDDFLNNALNGSLLPLENDKELMALFDDAGINLQSGWRRESETGETHLYGIPLDKLPGLSKYVYAQDGYLSVIVTSGNQENAFKLLRILCRDGITAVSTEDAAAQP